mmetsp:Transcript_975/g.3609  ORF Transcript_975/g.3609 Transcript_975/m.3609 type:complete len:838 (-) Transcript_975:9-2522(-)
MRRASAPMRLPLRRLSAAMPRDASTESRLFVRNLPRGVTRGEVRKAFEAGGCAVRSVVLPENTQGAYSGKPRGFAFVTVPAADAKSAREKMHGSLVRMNEIVVELAEKNSAPASTPRRYKENHIQMNKWIIECADGADVLNLFKAKGESFDAQNLATSFHRIGATIGSSMTLSQPLLDLVKRATESISGGNDWGPQGLANVAWGVARLSVSVARVDAKALAPLFSAIATAAPKHVGEATSQNMANLVWAFAKSDWCDQEPEGRESAVKLFDHVAKMVLEAPEGSAVALGSFKAQNLVNLVWAFATERVPADALLDAAAEVALRNLRFFKEQDMANLIWAYWILGKPHTKLFEAMALEAPRLMAGAAPPGLVCTALALQEAGVKTPKFFEAAAADLSKKCDRLHFKELSTLARVYALADPPLQVSKVALLTLLRAIGKAAVFKLKQDESRLNADAVEHLVCAFAKFGDVRNPKLFAALAARLDTGQMSRFPAKNVAAVLAAYADSQLAAPKLFDRGARYFTTPARRRGPKTERLAALSAPQLATLAENFGNKLVESRPPGAYDAPLDVAADDDDAEDDDDADALEGAADAAQETADAAEERAAQAPAEGRRPPLTPIAAFFANMAAVVSPRMRTYDWHSRCRLACAFASAPGCGSAARARVFDSVANVDVSSLDAPDKALLYQVLVYINADGPRGSALHSKLEPARELLREAYVASLPKPQRKVVLMSESLTRSGWVHETNFVTDEGVCVDIAQPSTKTAIEYGDPSAYFADADNGLLTNQLQQAHVAKERLLHAAGWRLLRVSYRDFKALPEHKLAHDDYMVYRLAKHDKDPRAAAA